MSTIKSVGGLEFVSLLAWMQRWDSTPGKFIGSQRLDLCAAAAFHTGVQTRSRCRMLLQLLDRYDAILEVQQDTMDLLVARLSSYLLLQLAGGRRNVLANASKQAAEAARVSRSYNYKLQVPLMFALCTVLRLLCEHPTLGTHIAAQLGRTTAVQQSISTLRTPHAEAARPAQQDNEMEHNNSSIAVALMLDSSLLLLLQAVAAHSGAALRSLLVQEGAVPALVHALLRWRKRPTFLASALSVAAAGLLQGAGQGGAAGGGSSASLGLSTTAAAATSAQYMPQALMVDGIGTMVQSMCVRLASTGASSDSDAVVGAMLQLARYGVSRVGPGPLTVACRVVCALFGNMGSSSRIALPVAPAMSPSASAADSRASLTNTASAQSLGSVRHTVLPIVGTHALMGRRFLLPLMMNLERTGSVVTMLACAQAVHTLCLASAPPPAQSSGAGAMTTVVVSSVLQRVCDLVGATVYHSVALRRGVCVRKVDASTDRARARRCRDKHTSHRDRNAVQSSGAVLAPLGELSPAIVSPTPAASIAGGRGVSRLGSVTQESQGTRETHSALGRPPSMVLTGLADDTNSSRLSGAQTDGLDLLQSMQTGATTPSHAQMPQDRLASRQSTGFSEMDSPSGRLSVHSMNAGDSGTDGFIQRGPQSMTARGRRRSLVAIRQASKRSFEYAGKESDEVALRDGASSVHSMESRERHRMQVKTPGGALREPDEGGAATPFLDAAVADAFEPEALLRRAMPVGPARRQTHLARGVEGGQQEAKLASPDRLQPTPPVDFSSPTSDGKLADPDASSDSGLCISSGSESDTSPVQGGTGLAAAPLLQPARGLQIGLVAAATPSGGSVREDTDASDFTGRAGSPEWRERDHTLGSELQRGALRPHSPIQASPVGKAGGEAFAAGVASPGEASEDGEATGLTSPGGGVRQRRGAPPLAQLRVRSGTSDLDDARASSRASTTPHVRMAASVVEGKVPAPPAVHSSSNHPLDKELSRKSVLKGGARHAASNASRMGSVSSVRVTPGAPTPAAGGAFFSSPLRAHSKSLGVEGGLYTPRTPSLPAAGAWVTPGMLRGTSSSMGPAHADGPIVRSAAARLRHVLAAVDSSQSACNGRGIIPGEAARLDLAFLVPGNLSAEGRSLLLMLTLARADELLGARTAAFPVLAASVAAPGLIASALLGLFAVPPDVAAQHVESRGKSLAERAHEAVMTHGLRAAVSASSAGSAWRGMPSSSPQASQAAASPAATPGAMSTPSAFAKASVGTAEVDALRAAMSALDEGEDVLSGAGKLPQANTKAHQDNNSRAHSSLSDDPLVLASSGKQPEHWESRAQALCPGAVSTARLSVLFLRALSSLAQRLSAMLGRVHPLETRLHQLGHELTSDTALWDALIGRSSQHATHVRVPKSAASFQWAASPANLSVCLCAVNDVLPLTLRAVSEALGGVRSQLTPFEIEGATFGLPDWGDLDAVQLMPPCFVTACVDQPAAVVASGALVAPGGMRGGLDAAGSTTNLGDLVMSLTAQQLGTAGTADSGDGLGLLDLGAAACAVARTVYGPKQWLEAMLTHNLGKRSDPPLHAVHQALRADSGATLPSEAPLGGAPSSALGVSNLDLTTLTSCMRATAGMSTLTEGDVRGFRPFMVVGGVMVESSMEELQRVLSTRGGGIGGGLQGSHLSEGLVKSARELSTRASEHTLLGGSSSTLHAGPRTLEAQLEARATAKAVARKAQGRRGGAQSTKSSSASMHIDEQLTRDREALLESASLHTPQTPSGISQGSLADLHPALGGSEENGANATPQRFRPRHIGAQFMQRLQRQEASKRAASSPKRHSPRRATSSQSAARSVGGASLSFAESVAASLGQTLGAVDLGTGETVLAPKAIALPAGGDEGGVLGGDSDSEGGFNVDDDEGGKGGLASSGHYEMAMESAIASSVPHLALPTGGVSRRLTHDGIHSARGRQLLPWAPITPISRRWAEAGMRSVTARAALTETHLLSGSASELRMQSSIPVPGGTSVSGRTLRRRSERGASATPLGSAHTARRGTGPGSSSHQGMSRYNIPDRKYEGPVTDYATITALKGTLDTRGGRIPGYAESKGGGPVSALYAYESEKVGRRTMLGQTDYPGAFKNQGRGGGLTVSGMVAERTPNYVAHAIMHSQEQDRAQLKRQVRARGMHSSTNHMASVGTLNSNASRLALSRPEASIKKELQVVEATFAATTSRRGGGHGTPGGGGAASAPGFSFHEIRARQKHAAGHAVSMLSGGGGARSGNAKVDNVRRIRSSHALSLAGMAGLRGTGVGSDGADQPADTGATGGTLVPPAAEQDAHEDHYVQEGVSLKGLFSKPPQVW